MDEKYEKILHLPHYRSPNRPAMARGDRAAQFAPFSALSGHAEGAEETARVTQMRRELSEDEVGQLDEKIQMLEEQLGERPQISATYFRPDTRKAGGDYVTVVGRGKKIDRYRCVIVLEDGGEIPIGELIALELL